MEPSVIVAARRGNKDAFARIVAEYQTPVYNLAFRMLGNPGDAEDATQETFLRAYKQIKTFNPEQNLATWLLSIAAHYCIDRLRRNKFRWFSFDDTRWNEGEAISADDPGPEQAALAREREDEVQALLQKLPPAYRIVTVLRYWNDLSIEEIAAATKDTPGNVKVKLYRARQMMAEHARGRPGGLKRMELIRNV